MKIFYNKNRLRMAGKAWEIRAKLKEWSNLSITVQEYLRRLGH